VELLPDELRELDTVASKDPRCKVLDTPKSYKNRGR